MLVFNKACAKFDPYKGGAFRSTEEREKVAGDSPAKHKYVRLDSYDPYIGEIVSRKKPQLSEVSKEIIIRGQLN